MVKLLKNKPERNVRLSKNLNDCLLGYHIAPIDILSFCGFKLGEPTD